MNPSWSAALRESHDRRHSQVYTTHELSNMMPELESEPSIVNPSDWKLEYRLLPRSSFVNMIVCNTETGETVGNTNVMLSSYPAISSDALNSSKYEDDDVNVPLRGSELNAIGFLMSERSPGSLFHFENLHMIVQRNALLPFERMQSVVIGPSLSLFSATRKFSSSDDGKHFSLNDVITKMCGFCSAGGEIPTRVLIRLQHDATAPMQSFSFATTKRRGESPSSDNDDETIPVPTLCTFMDYIRRLSAGKHTSHTMSIHQATSPATTVNSVHVRNLSCALNAILPKENCPDDGRGHGRRVAFQRIVDEVAETLLRADCIYRAVNACREALDLAHCGRENEINYTDFSQHHPFSSSSGANWDDADMPMCIQRVLGSLSINMVPGTSWSRATWRLHLQNWVVGTTGEDNSMLFTLHEFISLAISGSIHLLCNGVKAYFNVAAAISPLSVNHLAHPPPKAASTFDSLSDDESNPFASIDVETVPSYAQFTRDYSPAVSEVAQLEYEIYIKYCFDCDESLYLDENKGEKDRVRVDDFPSFRLPPCFPFFSGSENLSSANGFHVYRSAETITALFSSGCPIPHSSIEAPGHTYFSKPFREMGPQALLCAIKGLKTDMAAEFESAQSQRDKFGLLRTSVMPRPIALLSFRQAYFLAIQTAILVLQPLNHVGSLLPENLFPSANVCDENTFSSYRRVFRFQSELYRWALGSDPQMFPPPRVISNEKVGRVPQGVFYRARFLRSLSPERAIILVCTWLGLAVGTKTTRDTSDIFSTDHITNEEEPIITPTSDFDHLDACIDPQSGIIRLFSPRACVLLHQCLDPALRRIVGEVVAAQLLAKRSSHLVAQKRQLKQMHAAVIVQRGVRYALSVLRRHTLVLKKVSYERELLRVREETTWRLSKALQSESERRGTGNVFSPEKISARRAVIATSLCAQNGQDVNSVMRFLSPAERSMRRNNDQREGASSSVLEVVDLSDDDADVPGDGSVTNRSRNKAGDADDDQSFGLQSNDSIIHLLFGKKDRLEHRTPIRQPKDEISRSTTLRHAHHHGGDPIALSEMEPSMGAPAIEISPSEPATSTRRKSALDTKLLSPKHTSFASTVFVAARALREVGRQRRQSVGEALTASDSIGQGSRSTSADLSAFAEHESRSTQSFLSYSSHVRSSIFALNHLEGNYRDLIENEEAAAHAIQIQPMYDALFPLLLLQRQEDIIRRSLVSESATIRRKLFSAWLGFFGDHPRRRNLERQESQRRQELMAKFASTLHTSHILAREKHDRAQLYAFEDDCFYVFHTPCQHPLLLELLLCAAWWRFRQGTITRPAAAASRNSASFLPTTGGGMPTRQRGFTFSKTSTPKTGIAFGRRESIGQQQQQPQRASLRQQPASGGADVLPRASVVVSPVSELWNAPSLPATPTGVDRSFSNYPQVGQQRRSTSIAASPAFSMRSGSILTDRRSPSYFHGVISVADMFQDCFHTLNNAWIAENQARQQVRSAYINTFIQTEEHVAREIIIGEFSSSFQKVFTQTLYPRKLKLLERHHRERLYYASAIEAQSLYSLADILLEEIQDRELLTTVFLLEQRQVALRQWFPQMSILDVLRGNAASKEADGSTSAQGDIQFSARLAELHDRHNNDYAAILAALRKEREYIRTLLQTEAIMGANGSHPRHPHRRTSSVYSTYCDSVSTGSPYVGPAHHPPGLPAHRSPFSEQYPPFGSPGSTLRNPHAAYFSSPSPPRFGEGLSSARHQDNHAATRRWGALNPATAAGSADAGPALSRPPLAQLPSAGQATSKWRTTSTRSIHLSPPNK